MARSAISYVSRATFLRSTLLLSGGTASGGAIVFISMPLITRLYSPAEYSLLGVYTSLLVLCSVPAMLRYEFAVPICNTVEDACNTLGLSFLIGAITSGGIAIVVGTCGPSVVRAAGIDAISPYLWLLPVGVLFTSSYQALSLWCTRQREFGVLAQTKLTQNVAMVATQVGWGAAHLGPLGLMIGHIAGQSGGIGSLLKQVIAHDAESLRRITFPKMFAMAVRFQRFPRFSAVASLLDSAVGNMPLLVLASIYGGQVAGWYTLVQRGFAVPMAILSSSIGQVTFSEMAGVRRGQRDTLQALFRTRVKQLAVAGFVLIVVTNIGATLFVPALLGRRWAPATACLRVLSPMLFLSFVASPMGFVLEVTERQDLHLIRELFRVASMGVALAAIVVHAFTWSDAVLIVSCAGTLNSLGYLYMSLRAVRSPWIREAAASS